MEDEQVANVAEGKLDVGSVAEGCGVPSWVFHQARDAGIVPESGDLSSERWSPAGAEKLAAEYGEVLRAHGEQLGTYPPAGAWQAAEWLAGETGLGVKAEDIRQLAADGVLVPVGQYKGHPLYAHAAVIGLDVERVESLVAEREAWLAASMTQPEAAWWLHWFVDEFIAVAEQRELKTGRFGRYARSDIEALAQDAELMERIRCARIVDAYQAAKILQVRKTDFDYTVAAGWITPAAGTSGIWGFRTGDVEALLEIPGVDWEAVRAVRPGDRSPLRAYAQLPIPRHVLIRGAAADLSERYGVEIRAAYDDDNDSWTLAWNTTIDNAPTVEQVRVALREREALGPHLSAIRLRAKS